jgi:hypothetical protein
MLRTLVPWSSFIQRTTSTVRRLDAPDLRDIPLAICVGLPTAAFFLPWISDAIYFRLFPNYDCEDYDKWTYDLAYCRIFWAEGGPIEIATALSWLGAVVFAIRSNFQGNLLPYKIQRLFLILATLVSIILLGEELSWGQHIFRWETPEVWKSANYQKETNLHNLSWHVEKTVLAIASYLIVFVFILGPLVLVILGKKIRLSPLVYWTAPTYVCVAAATYAIAELPPKYFLPAQIFGDWYPVDWIAADDIPLELFELQISLIALMYFYSLYLRLKHARGGSD